MKILLDTIGIPKGHLKKLYLIQRHFGLKGKNMIGHFTWMYLIMK